MHRAAAPLRNALISLSLAAAALGSPPPPARALGGPIHDLELPRVAGARPLARGEFDAGMALLAYGEKIPTADPTRLGDRRHWLLSAAGSCGLGAGLEGALSLRARGFRIPQGDYDSELIDTPRADHGLADLLAGLKLRIPSPVARTDLALRFVARVPTGDADRGFSTGRLDPRVELLSTTRLAGGLWRPEVLFHASGGIQWNRNEEAGFDKFPDYFANVSPSGDDKENDLLLVKGGVEARGDKARLFTEISLGIFAWRPDGAASASENLILVTAGVGYRFGRVEVSPVFSAAPTMEGRESGLVGSAPIAERDPDWSWAVGASYRKRLESAAKQGS